MELKFANSEPNHKIKYNWENDLVFDLPCVSKMYPLLTGDRNETMKYHYSPSGQLNPSIFNLESHTLHFKIVHQTPEIQACKVKIYNHPKPDVLKRA